MKPAIGRFRLAAGKPRPRGFTLIELLVVIAILCILIAALIPMISKAKSRACDSLCVAKEKRYMHAYQCYSSDHGDMVLSPSQMVGNVVWTGYSGPVNYFMQDVYYWLYFYLTGDSSYLTGDPASPDPKFIKREVNDYWIDPSSGWNPLSAQTNPDWWHYGIVTQWSYDRGWQSVTCRLGASFPVRMVEFPTPSTTATFMCETCLGVRAGGGYKGPLYMHDNGDYDPWPFHGGGTHPPGIAGSGSQTNVSRLDGSVRTYPWVDLVSPVCHPQCFSDYQNSHYGWTIARQYLWSGKTQDGWISE